MYYFTTYSSPIGTITLACYNDKIVGLWTEGQKYHGGTIPEAMTEKNDIQIFDTAKNWLDRYFAGEKPAISELPLAPIGGQFRQSVWKILCEIPYGKVTTYGAIAKRIAAETGRKSMSSQAVGGAVGHNPISIIIPCHRVVGSNGSLTGFAGGIPMKAKLLEHEGAQAAVRAQKQSVRKEMKNLAFSILAVILLAIAGCSKTAAKSEPVSYPTSSAIEIINTTHSIGAVADEIFTYGDPELDRALQLGLGSYSDADSITCAQFFDMLDKAVELRGEDRMDAWLQQLRNLRYSDSIVFRFQAVTIVQKCAEALLVLYTPHICAEQNKTEDLPYTDALRLAMGLYEAEITAKGVQEILLPDHCVRLSQFNMFLQQISENFIFYSNDDNSEFLPEMARLVEERMPEVLDAFSIDLPNRISVLFYDQEDFFIVFPYASELTTGLSFPNQSAFAVRMRGADKNVISDFMIDLLVHETVHVIQTNSFTNMHSLPAWLVEGTAMYFSKDIEFLATIDDEPSESVRNNEIPPLSSLVGFSSGSEDRTKDYVWAFRIIEFISKTWGFDKVVDLYNWSNIGDFERVIGVTLSEFENAWRQYLEENY